MPAVISAKELDVGYEGKAVISGVDLNALKGQVVCLIGPNGAGKSTILRTLAGLLAPVKGTVYISGDDLRGIKAQAKAKRLAIVLTERLSVTLTSAREVVCMGRTPYTGFFGRLSAEDSRVVDESLALVGAEALAERDFQSMSDGEKQKIMIARALAQQPQLMILDEPTSHLDIKHKVELVRIINRLSRENGLTVVLALHEVDIAAKSCQTMLMVKEGRIVGQGSPEDILRENAVDSLYSIAGANYDSVLGSIELCNDLAPEIFIAAGAGTGAPVYRTVSRDGYGIATGILHKNDIDYSVSASMRLTVVGEESYEVISQEKIRAARRLLSSCNTAIDAGFPVGALNRPNIDMLDEWSTGERTVISMRPRAQVEALYKKKENVACVPSMEALQKRLAALTAHA
jgi:iron complex transport system ATP-binding protein